MSTVKRRWRLLLAMLAVTLATGCNVLVGGTARPGPDLAAKPVLGPSVKQVLPVGDEMSETFNQAFRHEAKFPSRFGGIEIMPERPSVGADDCLAVAAMMQRSSYQGSDVQDVAQEFWWRNKSGRAKVLVVNVGVIALRSAAGAAKVFADFSDQWMRCDGKTIPGAINLIQYAITDVRNDNSVLSDSVQATIRGIPGPGLPHSHAIGLAVNCLVEVDVAYASPDDAGTEAVDLAQLMMDKARLLS